jgi:hypothetical protein
MKSYVIYPLIMLVGIAVSGCMSPEGQPDYTASGALAGGATGAIVGSMARHPGPGALVGGAVGAVAGGLIGHSMDQAQQERLRAQAPQTYQRVDQGQPLGVEDVKALAKAGVGDEIIISQIHNSRTVYHLGTAEIIDLKNSGVSTKVIDFMINTPTMVTAPPSATVATAPGAAGSVPPAMVTEPVVVAPAPGYIWVPGAWSWYWDHWVWVGGYWAVPPYPHAHWYPGHWGGGHHRGRGPWIPGHWR